ncbi:MAG: 50S ribosomal protein L35 [Actinomycetota bacterium]|jgi:large subunit ribosomal protein L35|nr:50S ribosomal protein L35 [Actinomycetota bacterium]
MSPKQKTNSAAKKRFKVTGAGKLLRRHAMKSHNLEKKSAKRRRAFSRDQSVDGSDAREVRRLLGR